MSVEERIDDLIEAGWCMLESDFDAPTFLRWRIAALDCLSELLGPNHTYTLHFRTLVEQNDGLDCLAGGGILTADRYTTAGTCVERSGNGMQTHLPPDLTGGETPKQFRSVPM
jgi:hypothetical protein